MTIDVSCPCGKLFKVAEERAGTTFNCYLCNREILVPDGLSEPRSESEKPPGSHFAITGEGGGSF